MKMHWMSIILVVTVWACVLTSGCAGISRVQPGCGIDVKLLQVSSQWRESAGSDVGVAEIYLQNDSAGEVVLESVRLGGNCLELPVGEGGGALTNVLWWRMAPAGAVRPDGSAVVAIAFRSGPVPRYGMRGSSSATASPTR